MADIPLRPPSVTFYGAHIVNTFTTDGVTYDNYWVNFDLNYIAEQVDLMKALGANAVSVIGSLDFLDQGVSLGTYMGRRKQVADMLVSKGVYHLTYSISAFHNWGTATNAQAAEVVAADAALQCKYPNTPGLICMDEPWLGEEGEPVNTNGRSTLATVAAALDTIYDAAKAVVPPSFPVACGANPLGDFEPLNPTGGTTHGSDNASRLAITAPMCDFFPVHLFYNAAAADYAALRTAYPNKDFVFTSCGVPISDATRATVTTSVMARGNEQRGTLMWCARDYVAVGRPDVEKWGLHDLNDNLRTAATTPFTNGVLAEYPPRAIRTYRGKPRLNHLTPWGHL